MTSSGLETSYNKLRGEREEGSWAGGVGTDFVVDVEEVVGRREGRGRVRSWRRGVGVASNTKKTIRKSVFEGKKTRFW